VTRLGLCLVDDARQHAARSAKVGYCVGDFSRIDELPSRDAVVETADLFCRSGCNERIDGIERCEPRFLQVVEVDGLHEIESFQILFAHPSSVSRQQKSDTLGVRSKRHFRV